MRLVTSNWNSLLN